MYNFYKTKIFGINSYRLLYSFIIFHFKLFLTRKLFTFRSLRGILNNIQLVI